MADKLDDGKVAHLGTISTARDVEFGEIEEKPHGILTITRQWIRKAGSEESGIERILEDERTNQKPWSLFNVFFAGNACTTTVLTGFFGPAVYGLGFWDSFLCLLFFNLLGACWPSMFATFGPKFGLRTMLIPRYSFGWWFSKVLAILNMINQLGWGVVSSISGAVVLYDAGGGKIPLSVTILIITLLGLVISLLGYRAVHIWDQYSWMVTIVAFCVLAGFGASQFSMPAMGSGTTEMSNVLLFGTTIIGFEVSWVPVSADYGVYMRETTSAWATFGWAYAGYFWSQFLAELLGVGLGTLLSNPDARFSDAYTSSGLGGLIGEVFKGHGRGVRGFGKLIEVILAISVVPVIIFNCYSLGLSAQMFTKKAIIIPRFIWTLVGGTVLTLLAILGRNVLVDVMTNFLSMCAYWLTPFSMIVILEHFVFRRSYNAYDVNGWNDRRKLPLGIAASVSFILSTLIAALCMSQTWWVGPIAQGVGTDISWELAIVASIIFYLPLRYWERQRSAL